MITRFSILILFCFVVYMLFFNRAPIRNYLRRWLPSRWQQTVLPSENTDAKAVGMGSVSLSRKQRL